MPSLLQPASRLYLAMAVLCCLFAALWWWHRPPPPPLILETASLHLQTSGKLLHFNVEIARTPEATQRGLMYRKHMADNEGMLFIFPETKHRQFWMKNTYIPLDIIFVDKIGVIKHIIHQADPLSLEPRRSEYPIRMTLEINGGLSRELGIHPGDTLYLSSSKDTPSP